MDKELLVGIIPMIGMLLFLTWMVNGLYTATDDQIKIWEELELSDCEISNIDPSLWKPTDGSLEEKSEKCIKFINVHRTEATETFENFKFMLFPGFPILAVMVFIAMFSVLLWPERWNRPRPDDDKK